MVNLESHNSLRELKWYNGDSIFIDKTFFEQMKKDLQTKSRMTVAKTLQQHGFSYETACKVVVLAVNELESEGASDINSSSTSTKTVRRGRLRKKS